VKITHPSSISLFVSFVSTCHGALALCFPPSLRPYLFLKNQNIADTNEKIPTAGGLSGRRIIKG
jgi:hypothetical protein